jgi:pyrroloquinoline quinone (PQQ) biosynthesis protein C
LGAGDFPNIKMAVTDFVFNYAHYSRNFTWYLSSVIGNLSCEEHQRRLTCNLLEEQGDPRSDNIIDKPHAEIFGDLMLSLGIDKAYVASNTVCETVRLWRLSFEQLCSDKNPAVGLGALGMGTEMIVPKIYPYFISAIEDHSDLDRDASLFFRVHVVQDDHHTSEFLKVISDYAEDTSNREALRYGAAVALELRRNFWDTMLARALIMRPQKCDQVPIIG